MPNLYSLTTFSGLVVAFSVIVIFYRWYMLGAVFLIMDGAGGTAIFWDRWSARAGNQVHIDAMFSGVPPTSSELAMLYTHLPLAVIGLIMIGVITWRKDREAKRYKEKQRSSKEQQGSVEEVQ